jgi:hypothetical protein
MILSANDYAQTFRDSGIFWGILLNFQIFLSAFRNPPTVSVVPEPTHGPNGRIAQPERPAAALCHCLHRTLSLWIRLRFWLCMFNHCPLASPQPVPVFIQCRKFNGYAQTFRDSGIFWGILLNFQSSFSTSWIPCRFLSVGTHAGAESISADPSAANSGPVQSAIVFIVH